MENSNDGAQSQEPSCKIYQGAHDKDKWDYGLQKSELCNVSNYFPAYFHLENLTNKIWVSLAI